MQQVKLVRIKNSLLIYSIVLMGMVFVSAFAFIGASQTNAVGPGVDINVCGDSNPGDNSANWGEHNANSACSGCTQNGSCTGPQVWVYRCNPGQESTQNGGIQCTANGQNMGGSVSMSSVFTDPCQIVQIDVFTGSQTGLTDFVVWGGNNF